MHRALAGPILDNGLVPRRRLQAVNLVKGIRPVESGETGTMLPPMRAGGRCAMSGGLNSKRELDGGLRREESRPRGKGRVVQYDDRPRKRLVYVINLRRFQAQ